MLWEAFFQTKYCYSPKIKYFPLPKFFGPFPIFGLVTPLLPATIALSCFQLLNVKQLETNIVEVWTWCCFTNTRRAATSWYFRRLFSGKGKMVLTCCCTHLPTKHECENFGGGVIALLPTPGCGRGLVEK